MKALFHAPTGGRAPVPFEKRFLIPPTERALSRALAGVCLLLLAAAAQGEIPQGMILYRDDFNALAVGATPPGVADGCIIKQEDGGKYLACEKGVPELFKMGYYGTRFWLDYEWSFRFRFPVGGRVGFVPRIRTGFEATPLRKIPGLGCEQKYSCINLEYGAQGFNPRMEDGPFRIAPGGSWVDRNLPPLAEGRWYRTVIRVVRQTLDVYLENDGKPVLVYHGAIPPGGGGVNISSASPVDLADIVVTETQPQPAGEGNSDLRPDSDSPIPGTRSLRMEGAYTVADVVQLASAGRACLFSAYMRADRDGVPVSMLMGDTACVVRVATEWKRYNIFKTPREKGGCLFAVQGPDRGPLWVAAPQVEYAAFDPGARRAEGWTRTLEEDYDIDEKVAHGGRCSLRCSNGGWSVAVQEKELVSEQPRAFLLGAWCRTEGKIRDAGIEIEMFRDRKYWTPKTPREEEPRERFTLALQSQTSGVWQHYELKIAPRKAVKRFRLSIRANTSGGTMWLDDIMLCPVGAATASMDEGAAPGLDIGNDAGGVTMSLGMDEGKNARDNVLGNPGFEDPMTNGVVTLKSCVPSDYRPPTPPDAWMNLRPDSSAPWMRP